jgi:hypothetical protein
MMFWASSSTSASPQAQAPQAPQAPAASRPPLSGDAPHAHVFSLAHMHVHYSEHFTSIIELAMNRPIQSVKVR